MTTKQRCFISLSFLGLFIVTMAGLSFATFLYSKTGEKINTITTGTIAMEYLESSNIITISNALPTTDATGKVRLKEGDYFDFTVTTSIAGLVNLNWEIACEDMDDSTFSGTNIKYYLTKLEGETEIEMMSPRTYQEENSNNSLTGRPSNMMSLLKGTTTTNGIVSTTYRLRLYVDESYNPQGDGGSLLYKTRVSLYGKVGEESN